MTGSPRQKSLPPEFSLWSATGTKYRAIRDTGETRTAAMTYARILIVDDDVSTVQLLRRLLDQAGYSDIVHTTDPRRALGLFLEREPDLVCLDLDMPEHDGFAVLRQLGGVIPSGSYLPILMLTGDSSADSAQRALSLGARDLVTKPFVAHEVLRRIHNLLEPRFMHLEMRQHNQQLEERVRERTRALEVVRLEVLERLARAAEFRDDATGEHTRRVGRVAALLAESFGVGNTEVELFIRAAPLHDVGKIGIPDQILLKPGKLSREEFAVMQRHSEIGATILSGGQSPLMLMAEEIARCHHERWDGSGYPGGLAGPLIPLPARVVAVADVFDALAHDRPYRPALPLSEVLAEIAGQAGRQFDPDLIAAFLKLPHRDLV